MSKNTGPTKFRDAREAILRHHEDVEDAYAALDRIKKPSKRWSLDDIECRRDLTK